MFACVFECFGECDLICCEYDMMYDDVDGGWMCGRLESRARRWSRLFGSGPETLMVL